MAISHAEHAAPGSPHHAEHTTDIELHHDLVAPEALGGRQSELPRNYYRSPAFIGTLVATCLAQISGYLGSTMVLRKPGELHYLHEGSKPNTFRLPKIGSSVLALIGNIIGASAQSIDMLLATNTLNGIAAAGQLSFNVVIGELVPKQQRGTYNAIVLSTSIPFAVFGPPIARAFYENVPSLTFRMSYILGVAINVIAIVLYFFFYHPPTYELLHILAGIGIRSLPKMKWQMTVAGVIMVAFVASLASSTADTRVRTVVFLLIGAAGAGYVENLTLSAITLVWEPEDIGLVAGMMGCIRTAAGALATSMYSSILASELKKYLPQFVGPAATAAGLPVASLPALLAGVGAGSFDAVPGINADVLAAIGSPIKQAYAMSFRTVFLCTLPFGAILLLAAIFYCPNMEDYLTDEVARKLQGVATEPKMEGKGDEESQNA
ncbi:hypothetical protein LTR48_006754 [Friedmanniomyces endolithicus]|nr:hypothetical protein LTR48_006754 [Friedmanniomyces endolithicus]